MRAIVHNNMMLAMPDGFEDASQIMAVGPDDGGFRPTIGLSRANVKAGTTAAEYAAGVLPQLKQAFKKFELSKEGEATFGKTKGFLREHTFAGPKAKLRQAHFYVVLGTTAFIFMYTHLDERFGAGRPTVGRVFGSLRFRKDEGPEPKPGEAKVEAPEAAPKAPVGVPPAAPAGERKTAFGGKTGAKKK